MECQLLLASYTRVEMFHTLTEVLFFLHSIRPVIIEAYGSDSVHVLFSSGAETLRCSSGISKNGTKTIKHVWRVYFPYITDIITHI